MVLEKWSCDSYSTTNDTRTLRELNAHAVAKINGRYVIHDELFQWQPHEWYFKVKELGIK